MRSNTTGDIIVIDLGDVSFYLYQELRNHNPKIKPEDRREAERLVAQIFDQHLTGRMYWVKYHPSPTPAMYVDEYRVLLRKHPHQDRLMQAVIDKVIYAVEDVLDLPTWRILSAEVMKGFAKIELGEDYRVKQWTEEHGKEYGARAECW